MRKLLLILLLFLCSFGQAQIGWGSLSSNQWVSFQDAQGSGITQLNFLPNGTNWLTKQAAMYYLSIDTSYLAGMPKNQWVQKSQIHGVGIDNLRWSFNKTSDYGGMGGSYMQITVNYSSTVYVDGSTQSGSLTINDGDLITVNVSMNGIVAYGTSNISISSTGGLAYSVPVTGIDVTASQTFTYHTGDGILNIEGSIFTGSGGLYYNVAYSNVFFKNDCSAGYTGSTVTYTVPANTYSSTTSQAEADMQAITTVKYNGQAYANANGSCIPFPSGGSCPNTLTVIYDPSSAQDYSDGDTYMAYLIVNGYTMNSKATHTLTVNEGDSIVIQIHMPSNTKGVLGVNIKGQMKEGGTQFNILGGAIAGGVATGTFLIAASALTGGIALVATVVVEGLLNLFSAHKSPTYGLNTTTYSPSTDPYNIWLREKYSCSQGDITFVINNLTN